MEKHVCSVCNYIYDPAVGDKENGIEAGTALEELPQSWRCPICGESKSAFNPIEEEDMVEA